MTEAQKRFEDLARRSYERGYTVYSDFLGLSELTDLQSGHYLVPVSLWGGWDGAERAVACFGDREYFTDCSDYPVKCIRISPVNERFADALTHRDFLGSLTALGIRREVLGDIIISGNCGYLFCLDTIYPYIAENLTKVRRTTVECREVSEIPDCDIPAPEEAEFIVSSCRLDAVISAVFSLSRRASQELFERKRVFVNGAEKQSASFQPSAGDIVSVRGFGRFIFGGALRQTKKGRTVISIKIYK